MSASESDSPKKSRWTRHLVLFAVLVLLLFALWYDYQVARPKVAQAYDSVMKRNEEINRSADAKLMTNADVQEVLGREPSRTWEEGSYTVEEYGYLSGLPFQTHKYFAVYTKGPGGLVFSTHFTYQIPPGALSPPRAGTGEDEDQSYEEAMEEQEMEEEYDEAQMEKEQAEEDEEESAEGGEEDDEEPAGVEEGDSESATKEAPESASSPPSSTEEG